MKKVETNNAPAAIGPYSQAIVSNGMVYCSGQIPIDCTTNEVVKNDIEKQTIKVIENLKSVIEAAGSDLNLIVKVTVFITDMDLFSKMNEVYETFFKNKPARACVEVSRLPKDVLIEMEAIAELK